MKRVLCFCCFVLFTGIFLFAQQEFASLSEEFNKVAEEVKPSVVSIIAVQVVKEREIFPPFEDPFFEEFKRFFGEDFFRHFFPPPPRGYEYRRKGLGSGVIVNKEGYILTNAHVVENADEINISLYDGRKFKGEVKGKDPKTDLAVVKIKGRGRNLPVAKLGDSDEVKVGEWVLAIGNPFGLQYTVTAGIISAKGRSNVGIAAYEDFIQTDAAINPGNSGGPLVNLKGEVIGINTAIFTRSGGYMGIGFAIPINMAKNVMRQLIEKGKVIRGWLGIVIQELTPELAESFGVKGIKGVLVGDVTEDSPAERAGIKRGDIIVKFDGEKIETPSQLQQIVASTPPGTESKVEVIRKGKRKVLTVKVGEMPEEEIKAKKEISEELGIEVRDLTPQLAEKYRIDKREEGVIVVAVYPGSLGELAGIREGDLIKEINGEKVRDLSTYKKVVSKLMEKKKTILFLIKRKGYTFYTAIKTE